MKVVFPNSAWVRARERLLTRGGGLASVRLKVRYGVVVHPSFGPILIDTGYSRHALSDAGRSLPLRAYVRALGPELIEAQQPSAVLAQLGFTCADVKTVIVTHFHADHACALRDFPNARFVVEPSAWRAVSQANRVANLRHGVFPELLPDDFAQRVMPLDASLDILGDGTLVAVPLPGHALGHFGVEIASEDGPIFYGVDAQWLRMAAVEGRPTGFPARLIMDDYRAYVRSSDLVGARIARGDAVVLCHDPEDGPHDWSA